MLHHSKTLDQQKRDMQCVHLKGKKKRIAFLCPFTPSLPFSTAQNVRVCKYPSYMCLTLRRISFFLYLFLFFFLFFFLISVLRNFQTSISIHQNDWSSANEWTELKSNKKIKSDRNDRRRVKEEKKNGKNWQVCFRFSFKVRYICTFILCIWDGFILWENFNESDISSIRLDGI